MSTDGNGERREHLNAADILGRNNLSLRPYGAPERRSERWERVKSQQGRRRDSVEAIKYTLSVQ